jgi:hypothetical protein
MQGKEGRDHNPHGFSVLMAGGGIQGGKTIGATDEVGFRAVDDELDLFDLHATMLELLGLDHRKLYLKILGLEKRLTGVAEDSQRIAPQPVQAQANSGMRSGDRVAGRMRFHNPYCLCVRESPTSVPTLKWLHSLGD